MTDEQKVKYFDEHEGSKVLKNIIRAQNKSIVRKQVKDLTNDEAQRERDAERENNPNWFGEMRMANIAKRSLIPA